MPQGNQEEFDARNAQGLCQRYMNYHVIGQMRDGTRMEGIIEDADDQNVTMLVPEEVEEQQDTRQFGGYGGFDGYGGGYRRRFRRFRRRRFPYFAFAFPFIVPYPYYYPYPYY
ncbi:hypothetical protein CVD19_20115 [Bacillus sp. T33-2]|nr:hypothetical protein CVD19_20115 [Bacillus sp. T33-2]